MYCRAYSYPNVIFHQPFRLSIIRNKLMLAGEKLKKSKSDGRYNCALYTYVRTSTLYVYAYEYYNSTHVSIDNTRSPINSTRAHTMCA